MAVRLGGSLALPILICLACPALAAADDAPQVTLDQICDVWQQRMDAEHCVQYEIRKEFTARLLSELQVRGRLPSNEPSQGEVEQVTEWKVQITPESVWMHRTTQWLNPSSHQWTVNNDIEALTTPEGTRFTTINAGIRTAEEPPYLISQNKERYFEYTLHPLGFHHRPLDPLTGFTREQLELTTEARMIGGHQCLRLNNAGAAIIWVDVANDCLVRGYERIYPARQTRPERRIREEYAYQRDDAGRWVLSGWTTESNTETPGTFQPSWTFVVSNVRINGTALPVEELTRIPAGAQVSDGARHFIRRADGTDRDIVPEDSKLGLPTYQELLHSEPGRALPPEFVAIAQRVPRLKTADADERARIEADLKDFVLKNEASRRNTQLLQRAINSLFRSSEPEAAVRFCRDAAESVPAYKDELLARANELEGELRRQRLVGAPVEITGTLLDGTTFDWSPYAGKIVLIDFWFTGCIPCREDMPVIRRLYDKHHAAGFEVLGISIDEDPQVLKDYLADSVVCWPTIHEPEGTPDSNSERYNIRSFPTGILVGRDGKVISIDASEKQLETLVEAAMKADSEQK